MIPSLELRPLRVEDERSFLGAVEEFCGEDPPFDFALGFGRAVSFADYVTLLEGWSRGVELPPGHVPSTFLVGILGGEVVGRLSLRHELNDYLFRFGGHIGYGVRPTQRGRGYATEMLRRSLPLAAALGLERALLTCDADNVASRTVIERGGGILENIVEGPGGAPAKRRYWVPTRGG